MVPAARNSAVSAGSFIGLVVGVNVAILIAGTLLARRPVKRVAAERDAQFRALFKLEPLPPPGDEVQILVDDERGMVAKLDAVHWPYLGWTDARTLLPVEDDVLGWRWHPFRERRQDDPATWPREKLAAELERLHDSGANDA